MSRFVSFSLFITLFILLIPTPCLADNFLNHVTLRHYPPGSFQVKYGGLRGFLINQTKTQLRSLHKDYLGLYHPFDSSFQSRSMLSMQLGQRDIDNGGAWYTRRWWKSFPELNGGAPDIPIRVYRGPSKLVLDIGIAYITPDFRFRMKEYIVPLTHPKRISKWNLRVKPFLDFSSTELIRKAKLSLLFQYSRHGHRLLYIELYCGYRHRYKRFSLGINIYHLRW